MNEIFTSVPIIFIFYAVILILLALFLGRSANNDIGSSHQRDPYASGQTDINHVVHPTYYKMFAYAFFFTVMHVLALVVATAPYGVTLLPIVYIGIGILAMVILLRKRTESD